MKKLLTFFLSIFIGLFAIMINTFSFVDFNTTIAASSSFSEENLSNVFDIVPIEKTDMPSNLSSKAKEGETPYDSSTNSPMSGASIEPSTYDSYGQINTSYTVKEFSITTNTSIYMWIFFPDSNYYDLTIKFTSSEGGTITWTLNWSEISSLIATSGAYVEQFGWKLFEFNLSDAVISSSSVYSETFSSMFISYEMEEELVLIKKTSSNSFAFYHVYSAIKTSSQTSIVKVQSYAYYSISDDFTSKFSNLLVDDTLTFGTFESMFSYIYVAKYDLKNTTNTLYSWSGTVTTYGSDSQDIYNGETITFDSSGWCSVKIAMKEYRSDGSITVLSYSSSVYVDNLTLGSFVENSYEVYEGDKLSINFKISDNFVIDGEISVYVADKSIASVSYYIANNICYITVTGVSDGKTTLTVTANGGKKDGEISTYSKSVSIEVEAEDTHLFTKIILWATLIVYLIGMIIYVIISVINSRKNKVR